MSADAQRDTALVPAAEKLGVLAAQYAAEADRTRALAPEVTDVIREAGFARHFVGARWGGTEGSFGELTRAVMTVGENCASTAWCASLSAYSARFASHLPAEGHHALWGEGPDVFIATGLMPAGRAAPADGGWRVSGAWGYVSGVESADWVLVCAAVAEAAAPGVAAAGGGRPPAFRFFALPRGSYGVRQDWDSVGMRATASHTVLVDDVFVPGHLSFDRADIMTGRNAVSEAACHNVPFAAVGSLTFVAPIAGAATGALRACAGTVTGRRRTAPNELVLVRASGRIDSARLLVEQNAGVIDGRRFAPEFLARNERNATYATEILTEAAGLLIRGAGTGGLSEGAPLQRFWRDITSAASHVALQYDTAARKNYAAVLLGPATG
ncbi:MULTISPECIES: hypothetical protein [Streptomyces]|uniref:Hydrolase n=2 Tax=Streptomyces TaxID=1883 RepID=A0A420V7M6_9ACTN|nr:MULTISPECIES: hypothetical protein [Streptomyces]KNE82207.1 hypothetical protein ADZ36_11835 [Streptomyces fradiae]OFA56494.1 hypothetical protein BEN35_05960 [Streptomyces fradiae]RKM97957.1 hydrolase [Streptomyces xinghaiensis]RNC73905.1 hydrolase [Streptomyces xinghaiensis]